MYFLTSIICKEFGCPPLGATRTWGYYSKYEDAYTAALENRFNMIECLYDYLVIEKMSEGIPAMCEKEVWFKEENNKWVPCDRPAEVLGTCHWAIG